MMEGRFIEAEGVETFVIDRGAGPVLVFIHGAGLAVDGELTWWKQIEAFSRDHRVIVFDQVGFGRSGLPADKVYKTREQRVPHAIAVLRRLGVSGATLIGHSEGGYIALRIAQLAPELAAALVVVNSGSSAPMLGGEADDGWLTACDAAYGYDPAGLSEEAFLARKDGEFLGLDGHTRALYRRNHRRAVAEGQLALMRTMPEEERDMRAYMALQAAFIQDGLAGLTQKVALVWSGDDATVPVARGVALRALLPGADMHMLARAKHMVMHDRAASFNAVLRHVVGAVQLSIV